MLIINDFRQPSARAENGIDEESNERIVGDRQSPANSSVTGRAAPAACPDGPTWVRHDGPMADLRAVLHDQLIDHAISQQIDQFAAARLRADLRSMDPAELANEWARCSQGLVRDSLNAAGTTADPGCQAAASVKSSAAWSLIGSTPAGPARW